MRHKQEEVLLDKELEDVSRVNHQVGVIRMLKNRKEKEE
jgi:hypothetical protein